MTSPTEYVSFLESEYLRGYVDSGGSAVKFAVSDPEDAATLRRELRAAGERAGYAVGVVDAGSTKVHLMEQIFFELARQIDWDALAETTVRRVAAEVSYPVPEGPLLSVSALASHYNVDAKELQRDIDRRLQHLVYRDYEMVLVFRVAMLRLCQAALQTGQVSPAEHEALIAWLRGELGQISTLKSSLIYQRIARHNARHMLYSLPHWLAKNGKAGLLLVIDVSRLGVARRPAPDERTGLYYTRLAVLDTYEVLRQLVDSTDELGRCCVVVIGAPELLSDETRGLDAYQALKFRIFDEVRDRRRDNPFSSLVRIRPSEVQA
jgi:hypothetical protein